MNPQQVVKYKNDLWDLKVKKDKKRSKLESLKKHGKIYL